MPEIKAVSPLMEQTLLICFADGNFRLYDLSHLLKEERYHALADAQQFATAHLEAQSIRWQSGLTLSFPSLGEGRATCELFA